MKHFYLLDTEKIMSINFFSFLQSFFIFILASQYVMSYSCCRTSRKKDNIVCMTAHSIFIRPASLFYKDYYGYLVSLLDF